MGLLSIDFGTTNTVAALTVPGQSPWLVTFDGSPSMPSAVFAADSGLTVGRDAVRQARLDPSRYEPNPKRRIDDGAILLGDRTVPVVEAIAAILRLVGDEARRQLGRTPLEQVRLTHPAGWGSARRNILVSAARAAGLGQHLVLLAEPVAAAAQYTQLPGRELAAGSTVAVFDFGGGTLDVAVVGHQGEGFGVLAEGGLTDLGGLDFDQAVLEHVGRQASGANPGRWQEIIRQTDLSTRRAARALAEDIRAAKEALSRHSQTEIALPDPFPDAHLTRVEFEGLIRPQLARAVEAMQRTVQHSGVRRAQLGEVFLVGGSSRIPLVANMIQQRLGVIPVALDHPETAVALGAGLVPVPGHGPRTSEHPAADSPVSATAGPDFRRPGGSPGSTPTALPMEPPPDGQFPPAAPGWQPVARTAGRRRRRTWWIGGAVLAAVVAAALILVISRPFDGDGPVSAEEFATDAQAALADVRTVSGSLVGTGGVPANFRQTMHDGLRDSLELQYRVPDDSGSVPVTIRVVDGTAYLGGSGVSRLLPGGAEGKEWILLDASSGDENAAAIGESLGPVIGVAGTDSYVYLLRGATAVQESGQETIAGTPTRRFSVQIDIAKAAAAMPAELADYRDLLTSMAGTAEGTYWLDPNDRIVKAVVTMPGGAGSTTITVNAFNTGFELSAPDPSTVYTG